MIHPQWKCFFTKFAEQGLSQDLELECLNCQCGGVYARGEAATPLGGSGRMPSVENFEFWKPPKSCLCRVSLRLNILYYSWASRFVYIRDKVLEPRGGYLLLLNVRGCAPSWLTTYSIIDQSFYASDVSTKLLCNLWTIDNYCTIVGATWRKVFER